MSSGFKDTSGVGEVGPSAEATATHALTEALEDQNQRAAADAAIRVYLKHQADAVALVFGFGAAGPSGSRHRDVPSC